MLEWLARQQGRTAAVAVLLVAGAVDCRNNARDEFGIVMIVKAGDYVSVGVGERLREVCGSHGAEEFIRKGGVTRAGLLIGDAVSPSIGGCTWVGTHPTGEICEHIQAGDFLRGAAWRGPTVSAVGILRGIEHNGLLGQKRAEVTAGLEYTLAVRLQDGNRFGICKRVERRGGALRRHGAGGIGGVGNEIRIRMAVDAVDGARELALGQVVRARAAVAVVRAGKPKSNLRRCLTLCPG